MHAQLAVEAGRIRGILPDDNIRWNIKEDEDSSITKGGDNVDETLEHWRKEMDQLLVNTEDETLNFESDEHGMNSTVTPISNLCE